MAPAYRYRLNNQLGSLGADPGASGTTITFAVAPGFTSISDPMYVPIILDPDTSSEEIVWLTAYTAGATTGTISRGQEGSTAVAHPSGTWRHGPTAKDFWGAQDLSGNLGWYSTGDTNPQLQLVAGQSIKFGPGGTTAPDTTINRTGVGILNVQSTLTVGGASVPLGTVAYASSTTSQSGITTATDLTGLSVTITTLAGRRYKITGQIMAYNDTAGDGVQINIVEDGSIVGFYRAISPAAANQVTVGGIAIRTPSAGSHTYKLQGQNYIGGNMVTVPGSTNPGIILVEDIGV